MLLFTLKRCFPLFLVLILHGGGKLLVLPVEWDLILEQD